MVKVYSLRCPIDGKIKYIGSTKRMLKTRLSQHMNEIHLGEKGKWIALLRKKNLKPIIELVEFVSESDRKFWEFFYIELFRSWGFCLLNSIYNRHHHPSFYREKRKMYLKKVPELW